MQLPGQVEPLGGGVEGRRGLGPQGQRGTAGTARARPKRAVHRNDGDGDENEEKTRREEERGKVVICCWTYLGSGQDDAADLKETRRICNERKGEWKRVTDAHKTVNRPRPIFSSLLCRNASKQESTNLKKITLDQ